MKDLECELIQDVQFLHQHLVWQLWPVVEDPHTKGMCYKRYILPLHIYPLLNIGYRWRVLGVGLEGP